MKIQEVSNTYMNKVIEKNETSIQRMSNKEVSRNVANEITQLPTPQPTITAQPPPLPRIDNAELYTIHDEPLLLLIRCMYVRDRTRNAQTYIMEFSATLEMIKERRYRMEELWDRLGIIYRRVDAVR